MGPSSAAKVESAVPMPGASASSGGAQAGGGAPSFGASAESPAAVRLPGYGRGLSLLLLTLALLLLGTALGAGRWQAPHPDAGRAIDDWDLLRRDWWLYPLERHPAKRVVVRGHLDGLHVDADGRRVWVVGSGGLILHSDDAGVRWRQQNPRPGPPEDAGSGFLISTARAAVQGEYGTPPQEPTVKSAPPQTKTPAANRSTPPPAPTTNLPPPPPAASAPIAEPRPAPAPAPLAADLHDVAFAQDGLRGWAVGADGALLQTTDGGLTWRARPSPTEAHLWHVGYGADSVWIGDARQVLWETRDGGARWQPPTSARTLTPGRFQQPDGARSWQVDVQGRIRTSANGAQWMDSGARAGTALRALHFEPTGQRGWAVGDHGTILGSRDGGRTWLRQTAGVTAFEPGRYARYPAPWTWPVALAGLGLAALVALRGFRPTLPSGTTETASHVLPALSDDQPLTDLKDDRLGYRGAVLALSDFLRNGGTEPKLTLAITAPWGMGKTSIMGMLRGELHRAGFRTAWFNAWHHQQEGRPLTAMFNTIRTQAVPSIWREPIAAVRVRSRLLWARGWAYRLGLLLVGVPLAMLVVADLDRGRRDAGLSLSELVAWNFVHHGLQQPHVALTPASLAQLTPPSSSSADTPCNSEHALSLRAGLKLRPAVLCYVKHALVLQGDGVNHTCNDRRSGAAHRCVFDSPQALMDTIDRSLFAPGSGQRLLPSERAALLGAAETIAPPPLLPTVTHLLPLMALLGVLLTKGFAVYGLEVLKPLTRLFARVAIPRGPSDSGEPSGTIERYRREFCLLTQALDGRLVVFIDDLDRCDLQTINHMLEMSNYLIDHGRCFIVLAASMDQVKAAVTVPEGHDPQAYRNEYLRKLVHIELPVPQPGEAGLAALLDQPREPSDTGPSRGWRRALGFAGRHAGWAAALVAGLSLAGAIVDMVRQPDAVEPVLATALRPAGSPGTALAGNGTGMAAGTDTNTGDGTITGAGTRRAFVQTAVNPSPESLLMRPALDGPVGVGSPAQDASALLWGGGAIAAALRSALAARRGRTTMQTLTVAFGGALRTEDSMPFRRALALWREAIRTTDPTPRGLKRFCNRARLFAIVERLDAHPPVTPEQHVVALTALHHVSPELVSQLGRTLLDVPAAEAAWARQDWNILWTQLGGSGIPVDATTWRLLTERLSVHARTFGGLPDAAAVQRFHALLGRIAVR